MSTTPVNVQIPSGADAPVIADFVEHALRVAYINRENLSAVPAEQWNAPGVYVLLTSDGSGRVYVGQARRLRQRIMYHASNPMLPWTRAVAVRRDTTNGFNTAEIGYLEGRVAAEVAALKGLTVVEGKKSGDETLPPHMMISLDAFVKSILAALRLSGVDITRAQKDVDTDEVPVQEIPHLGTVPKTRVQLSDIVSSGLLTAGQILCLKQGNVKATGTVTSDGEILVKGITHSSPSSAAAAALGLQSSNGWTTWHIGSLDGPMLDSLRYKWWAQQEAAIP